MVRLGNRPNVASLCAKAVATPQLPLDKRCRWIGYAQACLTVSQTSRDEAIRAAAIMAAAAPTIAREGGLSAVSRALGFIQGIVCEFRLGGLSVASERDHTRPLFHAAYTISGIDIPPTWSPEKDSSGDTKLAQEPSVLGIIGTAGRKTDARRINRGIYDRMYEIAANTATEWGARIAVSGGAAVADHLAVRGYLDGIFDDLWLFLPCRFDATGFVPDPSVEFNPGRTIAGYHASFSRACGLDSIGELRSAIRKGARIQTHEGFHRRNIEVAAAATHLVAFTFGSGSGALDQGRLPDMPPWSDFYPDEHGFADASTGGLKDGGTAHTWGQCWRARVKRHVNLASVETALANEINENRFPAAPRP
jgi:hypothetical protein